MIPWLKGLLYDPTKFAVFVRTLLFALGEMPQIVDFGDASTPAYWVGKLLQVSALAVRAGDRNPASG